MTNNTIDFTEEKLIKGKNGFVMLFLILALAILAVVGFILAINFGSDAMAVVAGILAAIILFVVCPILSAGLKIIKPNEALVLTFFGKYYGTLVGEGYYFVNPFTTAFNPTKTMSAVEVNGQGVNINNKPNKDTASGKKISLKVLTLNNEKQKINDKLGNPVEIGVVVIWRVVNASKAVFNVDNYMDFLSIQADSALRNIVRLYPYDLNSNNVDNEDELTLRGSSSEVALKLKDELQEKVEVAGLEIQEVKITTLAYAPEIASAMLQRQQASAIIDARKLIVEGAVGMVKMALDSLSEEEIVNLDDERKAQMVSNLLVVLCGNKDAQPIVNSGSIY